MPCRGAKGAIIVGIAFTTVSSLNCSSYTADLASTGLLRLKLACAAHAAGMLQC